MLQLAAFGRLFLLHMASPRIVRTSAPSVRRDPLAYANRPLERGFDEYAAMREHITKLDAGVKGRTA